MVLFSPGTISWCGREIDLILIEVGTVDSNARRELSDTKFESLPLALLTPSSFGGATLDSWRSKQQTPNLAVHRGCQGLL